MSINQLISSIFYCHLEKLKYGFVTDNDLLLRHVDDFLLVTTDIKIAKKYVKSMEAGM